MNPTISITSVRLIFILMFSLFVSHHVYATDIYAVKGASTLNVRSGPGTGYNVIGSLSNGENINVETISNGWAEVTYNDKTGYVSAKYLTFIRTANQDLTANKVRKNTRRMVAMLWIIFALSILSFSIKSINVSLSIIIPILEAIYLIVCPEPMWLCDNDYYKWGWVGVHMLIMALIIAYQLYLAYLHIRSAIYDSWGNIANIVAAVLLIITSLTIGFKMYTEIEHFWTIAIILGIIIMYPLGAHSQSSGSAEGSSYGRGSSDSERNTSSDSDDDDYWSHSYDMDKACEHCRYYSGGYCLRRDKRTYSGATCSDFVRD